MARELTEEQKAVALAKRAVTQAAKMQGRQSRLTLGSFAIFRLDEANLVVEKDGDENNRSYYPTIDYCLRHVLHAEATATVKTTAKEMLAAIQAAEARVMALGQQGLIAL